MIVNHSLGDVFYSSPHIWSCIWRSHHSAQSVQSTFTQNIKNLACWRSHVSIHLFSIFYLYLYGGSLYLKPVCWGLSQAQPILLTLSFDSKFFSVSFYINIHLASLHLFSLYYYSFNLYYRVQVPHYYYFLLHVHYYFCSHHPQGRWV